MVLLHHAHVGGGPDASPQATVLFLHGILGSGGNLRSLAARYVAARSGIAVTLVDLRGHGRSPPGDAPHTLEAAAADLVTLAGTLPWPVTGVLGHSFGGKVALAFHALRPELSHVHILDSAPFPRAHSEGSEQTLRVLGMLDAAPASFANREAFQSYVVAHGHSRAISEWLAMNLVRDAEGVRLRPDLRQIRALLDDYFARDLWPVLAQSRAVVDVVIGGRSHVWEPADLVRLQALEQATAGRIRGVVLENAGHWLHVDDLEGTLGAIERAP